MQAYNLLLTHAFMFSDHFKYYDPNECKWKIEEQEPCTTESPTTVPSTTNAEMDYCEELDSKWTCSSGLGTSPGKPAPYQENRTVSHFRK